MPPKTKPNAPQIPAQSIPATTPNQPNPSARSAVTGRAESPSRSIAASAPNSALVSRRPSSPTPSNLPKSYPSAAEPAAASAASSTGAGSGTDPWNQTPERIPFNKCLFRVQNPYDTARGGDPSNPNKSKVSETEWHASEASVAGTLGNYGNQSGTNEKLWLQGAAGLHYVNIQTGLPIDIVPQENLKHKHSIVTIILPSALANGHIKKISAADEKAAGRKLAASLYGLKGFLDPKDRLWVHYYLFEDAAKKRSLLPFLGLDEKMYAIDFSRL